MRAWFFASELLAQEDGLYWQVFHKAKVQACMGTRLNSHSRNRSLTSTNKANHCYTAEKEVETRSQSSWLVKNRAEGQIMLVQFKKVVQLGRKETKVESQESKDLALREEKKIRKKIKSA